MIKLIYHSNKKSLGLFFAFLLLASFILRISSLYVPFLDIDESQFLGFAQVLFHGGAPYVDSLDTKPPFIYFFYLLGIWIFGPYNMVGIHIMTIIWVVFTGYSLFLIAKNLGYPIEGKWAALFYVFFSTFGLPKLISTSIVSIMVLPLCFSIYFFLRAEKEHRMVYDFLSGLMVGAAFLFKYQSGIHLPLISCFYLLLVLTKKEVISHGLWRWGIFLAGFILPILMVIGGLYAWGVWDDFVTWSLEGSLHYIASGKSQSSFLHNLLVRGGFFFLATLLLWFFLSQLIREKITSFKLSQHSELYILFIFLWFLFSWIPVMVGGRFYGHYFLQVLPSLCVLAALGSLRFSAEQLRKAFLIGVVIPAIMFFLPRIDQKQFYKLFPDDALTEQQVIGEWIKENSSEQDTLFVWGFATAIYYHAQRKPVSRFLWADLLSGKVPGHVPQVSDHLEKFVRPEAWKAFWEDINNNPPTYFVDTSTADMHHYGVFPLIKYRDLYSWIKHHYVRLVSIEKTVIYKRIN